MMLTQGSRTRFLSGDRSRGESLSHRRVEITAIGSEGALAIVQGSSGDQYVVGVDYRDCDIGELGVHCDCPRFSSSHPCKHLWAVLNKIDAKFDVVRGRKLRFELVPIDVSTLEVGSEVSHRKAIESPKKLPQPRPSREVKATLKRLHRQMDAEFNGTVIDVKNVTVTQVKSKNSTSQKSKSGGAAWQQTLQRLTSHADRARQSTPTGGVPVEAFGEAIRQQKHWFVFSISREANERSLQVDIMRSERKADGNWSKPVPCDVSPTQSRSMTDVKERAAFSILRQQNPSYGYQTYRQSGTFSVDTNVLAESLRLLHATGRFAWKLGDSRYFEDARSVRSVDVEETPWRLKILLVPDPDQSTQIVLSGALRRHDEQIPLSRVMLISDAGYAVVQRDISQAESTDEPQPIDADIILIDACEVASLRGWQKAGKIAVPRRNLSTVFAELSVGHDCFDLEVDASLKVCETVATPRGRCLLKQRHQGAPGFDASLFLRYGDDDIPFGTRRQWWWDQQQKQLVRRDMVAERELVEKIPAEAFRVDATGAEHPGLYARQAAGFSLTVTRNRFLEVVETLRNADWEVLAEGLPIRIATDFNIEVSSTTDWFDLSANADFDGVTASLPQLLAALRSGKQTFLLDDGSLGMVPEAWLNKFAAVHASGEVTKEGIRFVRTQALLLEALLSEQDGVQRDNTFIDLCEKLRSFEGIGPAQPPDTFVGTMRPYQQLGLGWFEFLREFRFGGCLADDMGLGKTIQVLAMLEDRRTRTLDTGEKQKPSLAVVPKSLIFNWIDEAKRFTPELRVFNYTGTDRVVRMQEAAEEDNKPLDLIITTYGTLTRDAEMLRETEFDYVILDEAQAIKNPQSQSAKASRLVRGDHRLAMTGTPVENHLGDLWSIFDFLNPGMLGRTPRTAQLSDEADRRRIEHVSRSLRPFILRRTKAQVLTELPEKTEQTFSCEMEPKQRKLYAQLKDHYRLHLSNKVQELGLNRSKIHVLEALLRLRQAACDPRLVNPDCGVKGAKIIHLMEQLEEVISEGHKALVFSQFTKLLALVRTEFDARGWTYEYLDGKTNKRSEHVKRFQEDDDCKLFLISLKAGGNGLNLTAADYVFILDPWWNPAVEAQAIDRAHRMGQTKSVMAYRMICENTVEEKILVLQQSKRDLADAIISNDKSLISELTFDDLQELLS